MKLRSLLLPAVCLNLLVFSPVSTRSQTLVTFDDLYETAFGSYIANGYQGRGGSTFAGGFTPHKVWTSPDERNA
jgi:hypothetical protein